MGWNKKSKKFLDFYLKKTWGPGSPLMGKLKKTFKELPGSPEAAAKDSGFAAKKAH